MIMNGRPISIDVDDDDAAESFLLEVVQYTGRCSLTLAMSLTISMTI